MALDGAQLRLVSANWEFKLVQVRDWDVVVDVTDGFRLGKLPPAQV